MAEVDSEWLWLRLYPQVLGGSLSVKPQLKDRHSVDCRLSSVG